MAALLKYTPLPKVGIPIRVSYVCGHEKRTTISLNESIPARLLHCECGERVRWIGEDVE